MSFLKKISLLGSTGSIGTQTLEVVENLNYKIVALSANENVELLELQARKFKPELVCIFDDKKFKDLKFRLSDCSCKVVSKMEGLCEVASVVGADLVFNAIVGTNGFLPTIKAFENKKNVVMANKESIVIGGELILKSAQENDCRIIPVDSEHSAIFQCILGNDIKQIRKIILTASGGPFFKKSREYLKNVTLNEALNHPRWRMGRKISIDSATMMNKGFELIEACHLFGVKADKVEIVVHPQAVLHSAVEFCDGAVIGQFGVADMRLSIQFALTWPKRFKSLVNTFSFFDFNNLTFFKPDYETFKSLNICKIAFEKGGFAPAVVHAANEKAVELFLKGDLKFLQIEELIEMATKFEIKNRVFDVNSVLNVVEEIKNFVEARAKTLN